MLGGAVLENVGDIGARSRIKSQSPQGFRCRRPVGAAYEEVEVTEGTQSRIGEHFNGKLNVLQPDRLGARRTHRRDHVAQNGKQPAIAPSAVLIECVQCLAGKVRNRWSVRLSEAMRDQGGDSMANRGFEQGLPVDRSGDQ